MHQQEALRTQVIIINSTSVSLPHAERTSKEGNAVWLRLASTIPGCKQACWSFAGFPRALGNSLANEATQDFLNLSTSTFHQLKSASQVRICQIPNKGNLSCCFRISINEIQNNTSHLIYDIEFIQVYLWIIHLSTGKVRSRIEFHVYLGIES